MKQCTICNELKAVEQFRRRKSRAKSSSNSFTIYNQCKKCQNKRSNLGRSEAQKEWKIRTGYKPPKQTLTQKKRLKDKDKQRNRKYKKQVIDLYGSICACCDESCLSFLSIDHIQGGGTKQRRQSGIYGSKFYRELLKQELRLDIYRVLCYNCNLSIGFYGYCPHKTLTKQIDSSLYFSSDETQQCKSCLINKSFSLFCKNSSKKNGYNIYCKQCVRNRHRQSKLETIHIYGAKCFCCNEDRIEFLSIDHKRGDGNQYRKQSTESIYTWLRARGYPQNLDLQILCFNCNMANFLASKCQHTEVTDLVLT